MIRACVKFVNKAKKALGICTKNFLPNLLPPYDVL